MNGPCPSLSPGVPKPNQPGGFQTRPYGKMQGSVA